MKIPDALKSPLKWLGKNFFPAFFWRYRYRSLANAAHEDELSLVTYLCDRTKTSVDVGASAGIFAVRMLSASRDVIAFEPRPGPAAELAAMFASVGVPARVETVALSDQAGTTRMRMLVKDLGRSTIEADNTLEDEDGSSRAQINVQVRRLDDYALDGIGFIKVDVEGHEVAVLHGAKATIMQNQPVLLIESEDRHRKNAVSDLTVFLEGLDYFGFFLHEGEPRPMTEFNLAKHQNPANIGGWKSGWQKKDIYINNFFFLPKGREQALAKAVEAHAKEVLARRH